MRSNGILPGSVHEERIVEQAEPECGILFLSIASVLRSEEKFSNFTGGRGQQCRSNCCLDIDLKGTIVNWPKITSTVP